MVRGGMQLGIPEGESTDLCGMLSILLEANVSSFAKLTRYTPMRYAGEMHAREICTFGVHAFGIHAYEIHAHEVYACKMDVYEVHAYEMAYERCTPMRDARL
jgi:hypothetical protein